MKQTLILLLCFTACFTSSLNKWKLSVKNDKLDGKAVVLVPGIFTKVTFVLQDENGETFNKDDDKSYTFQIVPEDDNLAIVGDVISLTPTSSLQATGYIGLKCGHTLSDSSLKLNFKIKAVVDGDGKDASADAVLDFDTNTVNISKEKAKIDLEPVMTSIPAESYTLMKVNQEPYNIEKIELKSECDDGNLETTDITIEKYDGNRGEYSPDNTENKGILFGFKLAVRKAFNELTQKTFNLNLSLKGDDLQKCYELVKKTFKIDVLEQKVAELKDNIKQAITYTLENISKKKDELSNLILRLNVPAVPVKVSCEIRLNTSFSTDDEILANAHASADVHYYNDILTSKGQVDLKLAQLNANAEYYTKCVFDTTSIKDVRDKIAVTIGNFLEANVFNKLKPSRDPYRRPQCAKIQFSTILQFVAFTNVAKRYCNWVMTKGESLLVRLFSSAVCEVAKTDALEKYAYICVAPSPLLKTYNTTSEEEGKRFDNSFDEFIAGVKDTQKILSNLGLSGVGVKSITKYIDQAPDASLLSYTVSDKDPLVIFNQNVDFSITSSNTFPIECYYNNILTYDLDKKFGLFSNKGSFVLEPGAEETITTQIPKESLVNGGSYPLYLECFSLPGASIRYETTGVFNPYTYYYDENKKTDISPLPNDKVQVDCTLQQNKFNPRCIKQRVESIVDKLKTDVPKFISEIEAKVAEFKATAKAAQMKILTELNQTLQTAIANAKSNFTAFVQKATETAKYLANLDCSIYASGSSSEEDKTVKAGLYVECRETKKNILEQIIPTIKEYFF